MKIMFIISLISLVGMGCGYNARLCKLEKSVAALEAREEIVWPRYWIDPMPSDPMIPSPWFHMDPMMPDQWIPIPMMPDGRWNHDSDDLYFEITPSDSLLWLNIPPLLNVVPNVDDL